MPWYRGPTLLEHLETVDVSTETDRLPFRFPVQWVNRPNQDFRGFSGVIAAGHCAPGDQVVVASSGRASRIRQIYTADGNLTRATAGDAVTLVLEDELDIARGDLLVPPADRPPVADQFAATILWMDEEHMLPGRQYLMRMGTQWVPASITSIRHRVDVNTLEQLAAKRLDLNEIGFCHVSAARPVPLDSYAECRATGAFILVDRFSNRTVAAGMVAYPLRRSGNIHQEAFLVDKAARAALDHQKPVMLWFTGLSGSGKSTIAKLLERMLHLRGRHTYTLDGDNLRFGLNRDLGFTDADRVENIRRASEVAKLMVDAGLIVICSFISPFRAERRAARALVEAGEFLEVFVDTPIEECMRRDPKGLYAKAKAGKIKNFTGLDSPYEPPEAPEIHLTTVGATPEELAERLLERLIADGYV
jgi:bifunctional enzyme CysN/CysC